MNYYNILQSQNGSTRETIQCICIKPDMHHHIIIFLVYPGQMLFFNSRYRIIKKFTPCRQIASFFPHGNGVPVSNGMREIGKVKFIIPVGCNDVSQMPGRIKKDSQAPVIIIMGGFFTGIFSSENIFHPVFIRNLPSNDLSVEVLIVQNLQILRSN